MKYRIRCCCLVMVLTSLCACAPVTMKQVVKDGQKPLTTTQLHEALAGQTLRLESIDLDAEVHYQPNGRLAATNIQGDKDTGKWTISTDDELCMKFDRWNYGDVKCYKLFNEQDSYVFFTTNGARSYTATTVSGKKPTATKQLLSDNTTQEAVAQEASPAAPLSQKDKEHNLISLARNCPGCDLAGVDLAGGQLVAANLAGANLSGADLRSANLRRANLAGANLAGARMSGTNLAGGNLTDADLTNADLTGSNLIRANVTGAKLTGAILTGALLESIQGYKE